ncbi:MAG TPA: biopolymer transporter ExbD [Planctomycetaceae bacterium]|jgi:biopolymer transport protein ExbD|nr:biopolymer transporter ExbD [Planctomycetaceae bacterium]
MRVPSHHARGDISENMMTSMIDVVFLLLIFFVCAAAGNVYELLLPTDLAAAGGIESVVPIERPEPVDEIWVYLTADPIGRTKMQLNGTEYASFDALRQVLRSLADVAPEAPVILDIAPEVEAAEMIRVYDTCRAADFRTINFNAHSAPPTRAKALPAPD